MLTRRERLRSATVAEIKDHARRLLVAGGSAAISLRAIAREMGMTAPALYRYFPSLDKLVMGLAEDLFGELTAAVEQARRPDDPPLDQLVTMARAFRAWALAHPAEFGLLFGNPVPGVARFEDDCVTLDHAGARFGQPFLTAFAQLFAGPAADLPTTPAGSLLEPHLGRFSALNQVALPATVVQTYLSAWARLYGIVALEVFGHIRWAIDDASVLFEAELAAFVAEFSALG